MNQSTPPQQQPTPQQLEEALKSMPPNQQAMMRLAITTDSFSKQLDPNTLKYIEDKENAVLNSMADGEQYGRDMVKRIRECIEKADKSSSQYTILTNFLEATLKFHAFVNESKNSSQDENSLPMSVRVESDKDLTEEEKKKNGEEVLKKIKEILGEDRYTKVVECTGEGQYTFEVSKLTGEDALTKDEQYAIMMTMQKL